MATTGRPTRAPLFLGMIIGHVGAALAARVHERTAPFAVLLAASFAPDLLRLALLAGGAGRADANLYSHVLPWSLALVVVSWTTSWLVWRGSSSAMMIALLVASHIALDFVSGKKELWRGGPTGLDLGALEQYEFLLEGALLCLGWVLSRRAEPGRWFVRRRLLAGLLALEAVYLAWGFTQRPWATRCIEHPWRPCWVRRGEQAPVPGQGSPALHPGAVRRLP